MRMFARRRKPGAAFDRFDAGLRSHALSPSMAAACAVHAARADRRGRHMSHSSASMGGRRRDGKLNIRQAAIQKRMMRSGDGTRIANGSVPSIHRHQAEVSCSDIPFVTYRGPSSPAS
jgi:hypothetical protein